MRFTSALDVCLNLIGRDQFRTISASVAAISWPLNNVSHHAHTTVISARTDSPTPLRIVDDETFLFKLLLQPLRNTGHSLYCYLCSVDHVLRTPRQICCIVLSCAGDRLLRSRMSLLQLSTGLHQLCGFTRSSDKPCSPAALPVNEIAVSIRRELRYRLTSRWRKTIAARPQPAVQSTALVLRTPDISNSEATTRVRGEVKDWLAGQRDNTRQRVRVAKKVLYVGSCRAVVPSNFDFEAPLETFRVIATRPQPADQRLVEAMAVPRLRIE